MSLIIDIAEAVKTALNAHDFSEEFTAERHYQPVFDLAEMKDLHVSVVPNGMTTATLGRGRAQFDCRIDVAVQKKLKDCDNAEIDPLMALVDEIAEHFRAKRLDGLSEAAWIKTENTALYAQEHLNEMRQFTSVLTLTFRVIK